VDIEGRNLPSAGRYALTWGDLSLHVMEAEKSAEVIVAMRNER
jgi:hypothetical protein